MRDLKGIKDARYETQFSDAFSQRVETPEEKVWVVLGGMGSGKSFTTRYSCVQRIQETVSQIREGELSVTEAEVPLWVSARSFVEHCGGNRPISLSLLQAVGSSIKGVRSLEERNQATFPVEIHATLRRQIERGRFFVIYRWPE